MLLDYLPPHEDALFLIEQHLAPGGHFVVPVTHTQIFDHLLPVFYPSQRVIPSSAFREDMLHDLALLYVVFASGCFLGSSLQHQGSEAESYMHLCRAALAYGRVLDGASLSAVQAVFILGMNIQFSGKPQRRKLADKVIIFAFQLAISVSP